MKLKNLTPLSSWTSCRICNYPFKGGSNNSTCPSCEIKYF